MKRSRNDNYHSNKRPYYGNNRSSRKQYGCERCGRTSHEAASCYAEFHILGHEIVQEENCCSRCGRENHDASNCFAKTTVDGRFLTGSYQTTTYSEDSSSEEEENCCSRCGRGNHDASNCFAKTTVDGKFLTGSYQMTSQPDEDSSSSEDDFGCTRCGRDSHDISNCYAITNIDGQFLGDPIDFKPRRENVVDQNDIFYNRKWTELTKNNVSKIKENPGIYEIAQYQNINHPLCVYVGHSGNLFQRLSDHLKGVRFTCNGRPRVSNIKEMKEEAEQRGFKFLFRYEKFETKEIAEDHELALLDSFCYAWNLSDNDKEVRREI